VYKILPVAALTCTYARRPVDVPQQACRAHMKGRDVLRVCVWAWKRSHAGGRAEGAHSCHGA
jgi:hypothetical protein